MIGCRACGGRLDGADFRVHLDALGLGSDNLATVARPVGRRGRTASAYLIPVRVMARNVRRRGTEWTGPCPCGGGADRFHVASDRSIRGEKGR